MNGKSERKRVVVYWVKAPGPKPMSSFMLSTPEWKQLEERFAAPKQRTEKVPFWREPKLIRRFRKKKQF